MADSIAFWQIDGMKHCSIKISDRYSSVPVVL